MAYAQRTLLEMVQVAQGELGLPVATTAIGNTDKSTAKLVAYAQAELEELGKKDWTALTFEYNLIVSAPLSTTGDTVENTAVITNIPDTSSIVALATVVSGPNIPVATRVISVDSATQVTLNMEVTGTETGAAIVFARDMYPEPDDFDHYNNQTWWDRTNRWALLGPMSPQIDQWHQSGIVATGPRRFFRRVGPYPNVYRIWPPPAEITNPLQLVYEYQSLFRVRVNGSNTEFAFLFANDADIPLLNDRLMIMGMKWRFWEQSGFNWMSKRTEYDNAVERQFANDKGAEILNMAAAPQSILISPANVQDGFFPGPSGPNME